MSTSTGMIGTVLSGRYRLESKLGSGGMSTVYLALDTTLDRQVAVKVMHREMSEQPEQLARFRQEARAVAKISHPNVVAVIDAGEDGGHPYIVFEYIEGETLKQRIQRLGRLPVQEAVAYAIEIGRGLEPAHARSMVHRDIKPQNVLIDPDGRAKVTDFGIARQIEQQGVTATGRVLGTTDYVSPEQAMGQGVDPRSDVYSLGVVLYEMLTGDVPFHAESLVGVAMKHVHEELPDVQKRRPEVSSAVVAVVERSTAKEPARRYQHTDEMVDDLQTALEVEAARAGGAEGEATTVLDAVEPSKRRLSRSAWSWAGLALILAGLTAAILAVILISSGKVGGGGGEAKGTPIKLVSAKDFDPPPGDGSEDPADAATVIDNNPVGVGWSTDHYATSDWGGLKDGVGIYVQASKPVKATAMQVRTGTPGWNANVYATESSPPLDLAGWGDGIASVTGAKSVSAIKLTTLKPSTYFLLWFTKAAPSKDGSGQYQVQISNIKLLG
jgi:serine/threonine-protein kinase